MQLKSASLSYVYYFSAAGLKGVSPETSGNFLDPVHRIYLSALVNDYDFFCPFDLINSGWFRFMCIFGEYFT